MVTPEIYTLSLHDALPIFRGQPRILENTLDRASVSLFRQRHSDAGVRSEEHTSELQSHSDLVCRLLLEKKNKVRRKVTKFCYSVTHPRSHQEVSDPKAAHD